MPNVMNDQELLNDLLDQEKQIAQLYTVSSTEASCPNMRNILETNHDECCKDQYDIFDQMRSRGFYQLEHAPAATLAQAKQKFQQMSSQL